MDFFQHRYYRLNKTLLTFFGQWPYQTIRTRGSSIILIVLYTVSQAIPQIMAIMKYRHNWGIIVECTLALIIEAALLMKAICSTWNSPKMLKLLNRIRTDWQVWARDEEVNILHEYAEQGRKMSVVYADLLMSRTVAICSTAILFTAQPIMPKIIDILLKNGSKPGTFPIAVDYYHLDEQKYYFYIITHFSVGLFTGFLFSIAIDTMFIVYVQHDCGIFAALGHKIQGIGKNERLEESEKITYVLDKRNMDFELAVSCIHRHNDAIEFAELIEATFSWNFFFLVGCNVFAISIMGLQIVKGTSSTQETAKFIICNMVAMVHLYVTTYMSQSLMDHSNSICYYLHNSKWYRQSLKTQKLLYMMMIRCNVPCKLTAGKIAIMTMETFAAMMKTSFSCLTVLKSI